jgi:hypothetical protein
MEIYQQTKRKRYGSDTFLFVDEVEVSSRNQLDNKKLKINL